MHRVIPCLTRKTLPNMFKVYSDISKINKLPSAILLDTDNTLYDYEPANNAALYASYLSVNLSMGISQSDFYHYYKVARNEIKDQLGRTASSHSRLLYFQKMFELLGCGSQLLLSLELEQVFWRNFLDNAPLFDDLLNFLNLAKAHGIKLGIVTDLTSHIQLRKLTYFNLESFFDAVVCSEEVGSDKPDYKNFQLCYAKLKLVENSTVWMIGDDPLSDIYGGSNAGCITFQKLHRCLSVNKSIALPDVAFSSYNELTKLLSRIVKIN